MLCTESFIASSNSTGAINFFSINNKYNFPENKQENNNNKDDIVKVDNLGDDDQKKEQEEQQEEEDEIEVLKDDTK